MENDDSDAGQSYLGKIEDREAALGFRPQREIIYNALLPYADRLDMESNAQLAEIKSQLGRLVQLRDIKTGGSHWIGQLAKYIRLNGLKFSKEDHLSFIHLIFEVMIMPGLDFSLVHKFADLLYTLLKKRELLSRKDLTLPWRPLYDLLYRVIHSPYEHHGLILLPENIEASLKTLIHACRIYFPVDATQEMLDEWRPLLCPFDVTMGHGLYFLDHFMPTLLYPDEHESGFKLWFDELFGLWDNCVNNPPWEAHLVNLFTRLASNTLGYINWEPYVAKIFQRILRSFNLPVGSRNVTVSRKPSGYEVMTIARWITLMLGNGSRMVQDHLNQLFKALESFYHPSNYGEWNTRLMKFLSKLPLNFVKRVQRERNGNPNSWEPSIPESAKLTNQEITDFVECMKPIVYTAMFSKLGSGDSASALQNLATLRPELVIPPLLEWTYPALETLTEPHRLIACLQCIVSVARSMLVNPRWYPEGPSHVIPLLRLSLPGIDPNDIKKSLITFQLISTLASLVPIVDCSEASQVRNDLTPCERELCSATAQFEDVVLQFFDRVIALIENSIHQLTRSDSSMAHHMTQEEAMLEVCLLSSANSILQQCSLPIYKEALNRLHRFATESIFEIKVAGRFTSDLIRAAAKVHPQIALAKFMPSFSDYIIHRAKSEDLTKEEHLDNEFLWHLLLVSELVRCNGLYLLEYEDRIVEVLRITLHLKCKDAADLSGNLFKHILKAVTVIYADDYRCTVQDWNSPLTEFLPIREWGRSANLHSLAMKWHVPTTKEKAFVKRLLERFLLPELDGLKQHSEGVAKLEREELLQGLNIILQSVCGAGALLPAWEDENLSVIDSEVSLTRFPAIASPDSEGLTLRDQNIRMLIANHIQPLLDYMLSTSEDDTKSLLAIIRVINAIIHLFGVLKEDFDGRWKARHHIKHFMEHKLLGKKKHIRALLVDRTQLQHELRSTNQSAKNFTSLHHRLFYALLRLSVSRYMEVRKTAQMALSRGFRVFAYSYRTLLDDVVKFLQADPNVEHHQFKGALYVILGDSKRSLMTKRSWEVMLKLWPAIVLTPHCEKPSVHKLYDNIIDKLHKDIETTELTLEVSERAIEFAGKLWKNGSNPVPSIPAASQEELEKGKALETERNASNLRNYYELINVLVGVAKDGNLAWKFHQVSLELLALLIRYDIRPPTQAVQLFVENMTNATINLRKISIGVVSSILKLQKRIHKKIDCDPYAIAGTTRPAGKVIRVGDREDNYWMNYNIDTVPVTQEQWDRCVFIEKTHWGYYTWPKKLMRYAPSSEQPVQGRTAEQLFEDELPIFAAFSDEKYVSDVITYLTLEENKGRDRFHPKIYNLFKGLFKNYDDTLLPKLKPHVERLVADTSHDTHELSQRCAAEIISGLIRGCKHWTFERRQSMWAWLIPQMRIVLANLTVESIMDWGTCFATISENQDPRKIAPVIELLMDNPLSGVGGSFGDSSRLYLLQGVISQQEWRVATLLHRMNNYLTDHLSHPYKNVRDRIGSVLVNMFIYDIKFPNSQPTISPTSSKFIQSFLSQLEMLKEVPTQSNGVLPNADVGTASNSSAIEPLVVDSSDVDPLDVGDELMSVNDANGEDGERKIAIRTCKTVLKWMQGVFTRMFQAPMVEILPLLPIIAVLESDKKDPELRRECTVTLACMAHSLLMPNTIQPVLGAIQQVTQLNSWHARTEVLGYIQLMVFYSFFILRQESVIKQIQNIILDLICDEHVEVRELAGVTLSGLLQCGYLSVNSEMLSHFERLSSTRIKKRTGSDVGSMDNIVRRHSGVIGISACILSSPYQVPDFMPPLLMHLSSHLNDPQPIQMTVKKTLATFKRTHLDSWHDHQQKFTDDQLVVLTELLVSPNYYA